MERPTNKHARLIVLAIFLVFAVPFVLAWFFYWKGNLPIHDTTNHGQFVQPPRTLSQLKLQNTNGKPADLAPLKQHWTMLYVTSMPCQTSCQKMLYQMRQIHIATGKNQDRVMRAIATFDSKQNDAKLKQLLADDFRGTSLFQVNKTNYLQAMQGFKSAQLAITQGYLYLVDPLGNVMMGYAKDADPMGILKDLEKLLKLSQIG